jgi:hypothetical protein
MKTGHDDGAVDDGGGDDDDTILLIKSGQAVKFVTCIRHLIGSNLDPDTKYSD